MHSNLQIAIVALNNWPECGKRPFLFYKPKAENGLLTKIALHISELY